MVENDILIISIIAAGLVGIVLGAVLHKQFGNSGSKNRELKQQLDSALEKNETYQQNVADHFSKTATLLNDLTLQYRDIHQHLASGADALCTDEEGQSRLSGVPIELNLSNEPRLEEPLGDNIKPPLDYAPKEETSQTGVLSEEFGLEKVSKVDPAIDKKL